MNGKDDGSNHRGYIAVDLGASHGRVMLGLVGDGFELHEMYRFPNEPIETAGGLCWDLDALFDGTIEGIRRAVARCAADGVPLAGIGVDAWGVDWVLHTEEGHGPGLSYRSAPDPAEAIARRGMDEDEVYRRSGIADQAINTALRLRPGLEGVRESTLLFLVDHWVWRLSGDLGTDPTIASTSQLFDPRADEFDAGLIAANGIEGVAMPPVRRPGERAGVTTEAVTAAIGAREPIPVYRVAGHDTACAFAFAEPGESDALISSGTWSLVAAASTEPVTTEEARHAGVTNERGLDGILVMRNLTGMWMLQECVREWSRTAPVSAPELIAAAGVIPADRRTFDVGDERLLPAGDMEHRVRRICAEVDRVLAPDRPSVVRAIIDSIAAGYIDAIGQLDELTGQRARRVRLVGGGALNDVLCRLTAEWSGLPVVAGPVEASAIGNIAIQARADGAIERCADLYDRLGDDAVRTYEPREGTA